MKMILDGSGTNSKLDITLDVGSYYIEATNRLRKTLRVNSH